MNFFSFPSFLSNAKQLSLCSVFPLSEQISKHESFYRIWILPEMKKIAISSRLIYLSCCVTVPSEYSCSQFNSIFPLTYSFHILWRLKRSSRSAQFLAKVCARIKVLLMKWKELLETALVSNTDVLSRTWQPWVSTWANWPKCEIR